MFNSKRKKKSFYVQQMLCSLNKTERNDHEAKLKWAHLCLPLWNSSLLTQDPTFLLPLLAVQASSLLCLYTSPDPQILPTISCARDIIIVYC